MGKGSPGIPPFDELGNLPPGIYRAKLDEIEQRFTWNELRKRLFQGLREALRNLASAGVQRVWLAGSFVSAKDFPDDVDGWIWGPAVDPSKLDPVFADRDGPGMKAKYGVDFLIEVPEPLSYLTFFETDGYGNSRGVLLLDLRDML